MKRKHTGFFICKKCSKAFMLKSKFLRHLAAHFLHSRYKHFLHSRYKQEPLASNLIIQPTDINLYNSDNMGDNISCADTISVNYESSQESDCENNGSENNNNIETNNDVDQVD